MQTIHQKQYAYRKNKYGFFIEILKKELYDHNKYNKAYAYRHLTKSANKCDFFIKHIEGNFINTNYTWENWNKIWRLKINLELDQDNWTKLLLPEHIEIIPIEKFQIIHKCIKCPFVGTIDKFTNKYSWVCKECNLLFFKNYNKTNKEKAHIYKEKYKIKVREKIKKAYIETGIKPPKRNRSIDFRLKRVISARSRDEKFLHCPYNQRASYIRDIKINLGYTIEELKQHIEKQFEPWMNWDNWGVYNIALWDNNDKSTWTWQVDHIKPLSSFKIKSMLDSSFKECFSLENLRPISSLENMQKTNKIITSA